MTREQGLLAGIPCRNAEQYQNGVKMGRLASGAQADHGVTIHALPLDVRHYGRGKALCGTEPGRRSIGWATDYPGAALNCPRCMRIVESKGMYEAQAEQP